MNRSQPKNCRLRKSSPTLEEKLAQLRRDHEKVTRLVDAGNLEITTFKAEMKARQDELAYIGNLLDEYARTFESKINISELQYCGEAIVAAKQATENTTLSAPEKFTRQIAFVNVSLKRLFDAIGGMRFPGRRRGFARHRGGRPVRHHRPSGLVLFQRLVAHRRPRYPAVRFDQPVDSSAGRHAAERHRCFGGKR